MPDEIRTEHEEEPFTYPQVERRTVTLYPEQWDAVDALAHKRHRRKASAALQEIVDWFKGQEGRRDLIVAELLAALEGIETVYAEYMGLGPDASQRGFELVLEAVRTARFAKSKVTGDKDDR